MRRLVLLVALGLCACVSVEPTPEPHGVYKPGQRLVVMVYQSPGPWIQASSDSKTASAAKLLPVGFLLQNLQDQHTLSVSKNLQQYLPRPPYADKVQQALLAELRTRLSTSSVQTGLEAGLPPEQIQRWNRARDQLDWRRRYYSPDPELPSPRDYKGLGLDDALILDVNLSFGANAAENDKVQPTLSAAWRVYRGENSRQVWEHVDEVSDQTSSATLVDFQMNPPDLTTRLESLAPGLGRAVGHEFVRAFGLLPSTSTLAGVPAGPRGGLLSMDYLLHLSSGIPSGVSVSTAAVAGISTSTAPTSVPLSSVPAPAPAVKPSQ